MVHNFNPNTWEAEAEVTETEAAEAAISPLVWEEPGLRVPSHPGLHRCLLFLFVCLSFKKVL